MACLALTGALATSCGRGPVEVDTPELSASADRTCAALLKSLPATVDGAERREVEPARAAAAAWGDPAIVLRCGVAMPKEFDRFATCQETNGVGWFIPEEQVTGEPRSITMTTIGRDVNVQVTLPPEHWPPANAMVDLARAIKQTTQQKAPCV